MLETTNISYYSISYDETFDFEKVLNNKWKLVTD